VGALARLRLSQLTGGFMARGFDGVTAHRMAEKALDGMVSVQAIVMSFGDIFHIVGLAFIATLPLVFLLGSGKGGRMIRDAH
jgi:DHA2 family multidrug resistance protein